MHAGREAFIYANLTVQSCHMTHVPSSTEAVNHHSVPSAAPLDLELISTRSQQRHRLDLFVLFSQQNHPAAPEQVHQA